MCSLLGIKNDRFCWSQYGFPISPALLEISQSTNRKPKDARAKRVWRQSRGSALIALTLFTFANVVLGRFHPSQAIHHLHSRMLVTAFLLPASKPACQRERPHIHLFSAIIRKAFVRSVRIDNPLDATPVTLIIRLCRPIPRPADLVCSECDGRGSQLPCYIALVRLAKTKWHLTKRPRMKRNGQTRNDSLCLMVAGIELTATYFL